MSSSKVRYTNEPIKAAVISDFLPLDLGNMIGTSQGRRAMLRPIAALLVAALAGCASQPHASIPPSPDNEPSVMTPPEPEATTTATDMAMFAERLRQVVALVVADFLSPDYKDAE